MRFFVRIVEEYAKPVATANETGPIMHSMIKRAGLKRQLRKALKTANMPMQQPMQPQQALGIQQQPQAQPGAGPVAGATGSGGLSQDEIQAEFARRQNNLQKTLASATTPVPDKLSLVAKLMKSMPETEPEIQMNPVANIVQQGQGAKLASLRTRMRIREEQIIRTRMRMWGLKKELRNPHARAILTFRRQASPTSEQ